MNARHLDESFVFASTLCAATAPKIALFSVEPNVRDCYMWILLTFVSARCINCQCRCEGMIRPNTSVLRMKRSEIICMPHQTPYTLVHSEFCVLNYFYHTSNSC